MEFPDWVQVKEKKHHSWLKEACHEITLVTYTKRTQMDNDSRITEAIVCTHTVVITIL